MPGPMSGLDLARELRERRPELPVSFDHGLRGSALGSAYAEHVDVLAKPYDLPNLTRR